MVENVLASEISPAKNTTDSDASEGNINTKAEHETPSIITKSCKENRIIETIQKQSENLKNTSPRRRSSRKSTVINTKATMAITRQKSKEKNMFYPPIKAFNPPYKPPRIQRKLSVTSKQESSKPVDKSNSDIIESNWQIPNSTNSNNNTMQQNQDVIENDTVEILDDLDKYSECMGALGIGKVWFETKIC